VFASDGILHLFKRHKRLVVSTPRADYFTLFLRHRVSFDRGCKNSLGHLIELSFSPDRINFLRLCRTQAIPVTVAPAKSKIISLGHGGFGIGFLRLCRGHYPIG
jgi:hypothetical protein